MRIRILRTLLPILLAGGCSLAPGYKVPETPSPVAYKEQGIWTVGKPQDIVPRQSWWTLYGDVTLNGLERRIETANPTLAQAAARYDAAQGYLAEAQSGLFPTLTAEGHADTNRQSDNRPLRSASQPSNYGDDLAGISLSWDLDLWGRIRNEIAAGQAVAQSSLADLQAIRLSLEAQLGGDYVQLRGLDAQAQLLHDTITIYQKAFELTDARHTKGLASGLDVSRALTQLADVQTDLSDVQARRALLEHAIASLIGEAASQFVISPAVVALNLPQVPAGVPSTLLQHRPDIAAAERLVAATNADIGVARAAFYPDVSLSALAGFQNTGNDTLFTAPNAFWSLGPSMALTLFDVGRHEGALEVAKAENNQAAAAYRAAVLRAFQEVEDNLALLNRLADAADSKAVSVKAATHTQDLALALYQNGALGYLDVVVAQTTALKAQQDALSIETRRLAASIGLIRSTGGGWTDQDMAGTPAPHGKNPT